jgi:hypothetical protein
MEDLVLRYGGKVANNVSGKTNYVLVGSRLEDGRDVKEGSKYRNAQEKKVKIITEDEFLDKIQASNPKNEFIDWHAPSVGSSLSTTTSIKPNTTATTTAATATAAATAAGSSLSSSLGSSSGNSSSSSSNSNAGKPSFYPTKNTTSNNSSSSSSGSSSSSSSRRVLCLYG